MTLATESVACDLCGADDPEPYLPLVDRMLLGRSERYRLVRCRRCGLLYLDPRPTPDALVAAYPDDYAPFTRHGIAARAKSAQTRRTVDALWPYLQPPARVLDLGCATGDLLDAVRAHGNLNVLGIEPSERAAAIARSVRQLDVHVGDLESAALPTASVDVALLSHVLEHLASPSATLRELRRVLRPGGTLVLWLPNAASLAATVLRERWMGYDAPRHLYAFSIETLSSTLDRAGFAVTEVSHEWIGLEWSWGLRYLVRERSEYGWMDRGLARLHPFTTAAFTPLSALAAAVGRAGRIRVTARARPVGSDQLPARQAATGRSSAASMAVSRAASASRASLRSPKR